MSEWTPARDVVMSYVGPEKIEAIGGAAASGAHHLESARGALDSAMREVSHNPESAYILAYDAARKAAVAVLAQQGLRARGSGHHATVQEIVRVQCGGPFEHLNAMRMRRNELEYPLTPEDAPDAEETLEVIDWAQAMIDTAEALLSDLEIFDLNEDA